MSYYDYRSLTQAYANCFKLQCTPAEAAARMSQEIEVSKNRDIDDMGRNLAMLEHSWFEDGCPYYNVTEADIAESSRVDLHKTRGAELQMPQRTMALRIPKGAAFYNIEVVFAGIIVHYASMMELNSHKQFMAEVGSPAYVGRLLKATANPTAHQDFLMAHQRKMMAAVTRYVFVGLQFEGNVAVQVVGQNAQIHSPNVHLFKLCVKPNMAVDQGCQEVDELPGPEVVQGTPVRLLTHLTPKDADTYPTGYLKQTSF